MLSRLLETLYRSKLEFILTYTTGRSGTGFLSQVFGHGKFDKLSCHRVGCTSSKLSGLEMPFPKRQFLTATYAALLAR
jgi:hypothetical protein